MQHLLAKGLQATAPLWSPLQSAYTWVWQAAHILNNQEQSAGAQVRERYFAHLQQMQEQKTSVGRLSTAIDHFLHITNNFAAGLFHCYDLEGLPSTNNE